jgi:hypothetical protein
MFSSRPISHADFPLAAHSRRSSSRGDSAMPSTIRLVDRQMAPSRRQRQIGEATQIERRACFSENSTETLGIAAGGEAVDKRLEYTMHAVTAVLHEPFCLFGGGLQ